jgi:hypothetical protein
MHVAPTLKDRGFVLLFNPTNETITRNINLPLYYSGLKGKVSVRQKDEAETVSAVSSNQTINLTASIPAGGYTWYVIRAIQ